MGSPISSPAVFLLSGQNFNKTVMEGGVFWHMNCGKKVMARKINEPGFSAGIGGQPEIHNHRPILQVTPFLVPNHLPPRNQPPKRRLEIAIEVKPGAEVPSPVKIIHTVQF
jgi:hypothetical protein